MTWRPVAGRDRDAVRGCPTQRERRHRRRPRSGDANDFGIDVHAALDRKIAALVAHRSQYALDAELLPRQVLGPLLGTEHFTVVVDVGRPGRW